MFLDLSVQSRELLHHERDKAPLVSDVLNSYDIVWHLYSVDILAFL
jgi:hypothetical protein